MAAEDSASETGGSTAPPSATEPAEKSRSSMPESLKKLKSQFGQNQFGESTLSPSKSEPALGSDYITSLEERLKQMEMNFANISHPKKKAPRSSSPASEASRSRSSSVASKSDTGEKAPKWPVKAIPKVRDCNWEQFKNYYSEDEANTAIDVLMEGSQLQRAIALEQLKRYDSSENILSLSEEDIHWLTEQVKRSTPPDQKEPYIQRVRIKAPVVLRTLAKYLKTSWAKEPVTFFRPFRTFVHFYDNMKEDLEDMAKKVKENEDSPGDGRLESMSGAIRSLAIFDPADGLSLSESYDNFKCFMDFVEERVKPIYHQFDFQENPSLKVRYEDLFYLFRVGEYVYVPEAKNKAKAPGLEKRLMSDDDDHSHMSNPFDIRNLLKTEKPRPPPPDSIAPKAIATLSTSAFRNVWRVYFTCPSRPIYRIDPISIQTGGVVIPEPPDRNEYCEISAYYVDYDGESYGPVDKEFRINYFTGEKDIRTLPIYPLRYAENREEVFQRLQRSGKAFTSYIESMHLSYRGWTLTTNDVGEPLQNEKQVPIKNPEHIDSDVIVDFAEAFVANPTWKPTMERKAPFEVDIVTKTDEGLPLKMWSDSSRSSLVWSTEESLCRDDYIDTIQRNDYVEKDPILKEGVTVESLSSDHTALLPRRMFAYSLRERKFMYGDVHCFGNISRNANAFDDLKIDPNLKRTVLGLVHSHFETKKVDRLAMDKMELAREDLKAKFDGDSSLDELLGLELMSQDFIRGKGKGLFILLHGVPGVGKTATAEAAAQANNKPLFTITCGDLGFTPEVVEKSLNEIFRLAHQWDCVLLLDEADVFLSQRLPNDLERNALVSVFLRVLEYYQGILFLTTNRPGILDEAVKSRVHVSLFYPRLGRDETLRVFEMNLNRLEKIEEQRFKLMQDKPKLFIFKKEILEFALIHYDSHTDDAGRWNGRQIRNAFQIASSLAHYDSIENEGSQPQLHAKHFELVAQAVTSFDNFRTQTLGKSDSDMAHNRNERYDKFDPNATFKAPSRRDTSHPSSFTPAKASGYVPPAQPAPTTPQPQNRPTPSSGTSMMYQGDQLNIPRTSPSPMPAVPPQGYGANSYNSAPAVPGYPSQFQQPQRQPQQQPQQPPLQHPPQHHQQHSQSGQTGQWVPTYGQGSGGQPQQPQQPQQPREPEQTGQWSQAQTQGSYTTRPANYGSQEPLAQDWGNVPGNVPAMDRQFASPPNYPGLTQSPH